MNVAELAERIQTAEDWDFQNKDRVRTAHSAVFLGSGPVELLVTLKYCGIGMSMFPNESATEITDFISGQWEREETRHGVDITHGGMQLGLESYIFDGSVDHEMSPLDAGVFKMLGILSCASPKALAFNACAYLGQGAANEETALTAYQRWSTQLQAMGETHAAKKVAGFQRQEIGHNERYIRLHERYYARLSPLLKKLLHFNARHSDMVGVKELGEPAIGGVISDLANEDNVSAADLVKDCYHVLERLYPDLETPTDGTDSITKHTVAAMKAYEQDRKAGQLIEALH